MGSKEKDSRILQSLFEQRAASPLPQRLAEIGALWERARGGHVATLIGCSCGSPTAHVSAADFELDLMDFILSKYEAGEAGKFLQALPTRDIAGLLAALASLDPPPTFASDVAADLIRSIGSLAGGGRRVFATDVR